MWCSHKYGKIEDGYQYCEKCGKAIVAPLIKPAPCVHKWKEFSTIKQRGPWDGDYRQTGWMFRCELCGEMKKVSIFDD